MADGQALRITGSFIAAMFEACQPYFLGVRGLVDIRNRFQYLVGGCVNEYLVLLWFVMFHCEMLFRVF